MAKHAINTYLSLKQRLFWVHGLIAGVYLSDSGADTIIAYSWNVWWMFIWSLCLVGIFYIIKEKPMGGGVMPVSDVQMPKPDLDKYKQDETLK